MPRDIGFINDAVSQLVRREIELFTDRYALVGADEATRVLTQAVPIVNRIISIVHWRKIWSSLGEIADGNAPAPQNHAVQGETAMPKTRGKS